MQMIYGDVSEKKHVHKAFKKRLGDNYKKKLLGIYDCIDKKICLNGYGKTVCVNEMKEKQISTLIGAGYKKDYSKCKNCSKQCYVRFADFEIAPNRAFYERKVASDFAASRKDRLYTQLQNLDTYVESRKGLILEGEPKYKFIQDSYWGKIEQGIRSFENKSPLKQAIYFGGEDSKNWTLSFIRECKMRDVEFTQTYDIDETIEFLKQCDEGYDKEPKLRIIPKRYPSISLERNILIQFDGIGKVRSKRLLKQYKSLPNLIKSLKKMPKDKIEKNAILKQLYNTFVKNGL